MTAPQRSPHYHSGPCPTSFSFMVLGVVLPNGLHRLKICCPLWDQQSGGLGFRLKSSPEERDAVVLRRALVQERVIPSIQNHCMSPCNGSYAYLRSATRWTASWCNLILRFAVGMFDPRVAYLQFFPHFCTDDLVYRLSLINHP